MKVLKQSRAVADLAFSVERGLLSIVAVLGSSLCQCPCCLCSSVVFISWVVGSFVYRSFGFDLLVFSLVGHIARSDSLLFS